MMAMLPNWLSLLILSVQMVQAYINYQAENLVDWCGSSNPVKLGRYGLIKLWEAPIGLHEPCGNCTVTFDLAGFYPQMRESGRLLLTLEEITGCDVNNAPTVELTDGRSTADSSLARLVLKRSSSGRSYYHSTQRYTTVTYSNTQSCKPNFIIRYTVYTHECSSFPSATYTCSNGRCIDGKLQCDGYNNCENFDDERGVKCLSADALAIIIVSVVFVSIFLCCCCWSCVSSRASGRDTTRYSRRLRRRLRRRARGRQEMLMSPVGGDQEEWEEEGEGEEREEEREEGEGGYPPPADLPCYPFPPDSDTLRYVTSCDVLRPPPYYAVVRVPQETGVDGDKVFVGEPPPAYSHLDQNTHQDGRTTPDDAQP